MRTRMIRLIALAAISAGLAVPAAAQKGKDVPEGAVGYGGAKVQMHPIMVPTRNSAGQVRFEVLTVRLVLDAGPKERPACFSVPIVQEKMLMYLYRAKLVPGDLIGQRREVLAKALLDVAIKSTAKGFYSGVELVEGTSQVAELDPKSQTLSNQCK